MKEKQFLEYIRSHPGARNHEIADAINCWTWDVVRMGNNMIADGLVRLEVIAISGNYSYRWYAVE